MQILKPPTDEGKDETNLPEAAKTDELPKTVDGKSTLPPDLRRAFDESWSRLEEAYRYLGR